MVYKCLEITAKSEDDKDTVKLRFEGINYIMFGKYDVDGAISKIELEKTDEGMLEVKVENLEDVEMDIVAEKLIITKE